jgi:hypothetical protein
MSGTLLSLVSHLSMHTHTSVNHNLPLYKSNHFQDIITNNNSTILNYNFVRASDSIEIEYLIIKCPSEMQLNENNLYELIDKLNTIEITIGGMYIWKNKINLFTKLNKPKIINNSLCIKLPFDMFVDEIKLISLQYHEVKCFISLNQSLPNYEFNIYYNQKFYDNEPRREMAQNNYETPIQQISSHIIELNEPSNILTQNLFFSGLSKGYLFDGNINQISNFKLSLNGVDYLDYNQIMLQLYGIKINDNLMFLPFDTHVNYKDITPTSFITGLNHAYINDVKCIINFIEPQIKFAIHTIEHNILRYGSGMGGVHFAERSIINIFNTPENRIIHNTPIIHNFRNNNSSIIWTSINKIIDLTKNDECPIIYKTFEPNCSYCVCSVCKYNLDADSLKHYFSITNNKCPLCRSPWTDYIIYINRENV